MGNQWTKVTNQTNADFYIMSFNDADLVYSTYFSFMRVPAGQTRVVQCPIFWVCTDAVFNGTGPRGDFCAVSGKFFQKFFFWNLRM